MLRMLFIAALLSFNQPSRAETFDGYVTRVLDGDTLQIRDPNGRASNYRLLGVDAPNKGQADYQKSKQALQLLVEGQRVTVDGLPLQVCLPGGQDCFRLGKVFLNGSDVGLRQIQTGFGWHDRHYLREQSTTDKTLYNDAQNQARLKRQGIWTAAKPVPPWESSQSKQNAATRTRPKS